MRKPSKMETYFHATSDHTELAKIIKLCKDVGLTSLTTIEQIINPTDTYIGIEVNLHLKYYTLYQNWEPWESPRISLLELIVRLERAADERTT